MSAHRWKKWANRTTPMTLRWSRAQQIKSKREWARVSRRFLCFLNVSHLRSVLQIFKKAPKAAKGDRVNVRPMGKVSAPMNPSSIRPILSHINQSFHRSSAPYSPLLLQVNTLLVNIIEGQQFPDAKDRKSGRVNYA
jgi:hypothetical protein